MGVVSYPAPVGGWNARDDLASMPPTDAVKLINFRPRPGRVELRGGQFLASFGPGEGDQVGSAATFNSTFGDVLIFSIGDYLYGWDGETFASSVVYTGTQKTSRVYWDSTHFQDRLIMTAGNGTAPAQVITYDGTTISSTALNITTGPNEEDIKGVQVHKGRAYYWEGASQSFWYAKAGAFQGDLTEFDLGSTLRVGGTLQMMVSISLDGGGGQDDLAAFVFSSGEVLVYQGDDPGDAAAWELVGSFEIGRPVNPQAHAKIAGTELVCTADGVIDILAALKLGRFGETAEFTSKITKAITSAARAYSDNPGWQIVHAPSDNCVIINIPITVTNDGSEITTIQYIRETDTGAWWECRNWNGFFVVFQDKLHLVSGRNGAYLVNQCFSVDLKDITGTEGNITAQAIPAHTTMGNPSARKVLTAVKPFTNVKDGQVQVSGLSNFSDSFPAVTSDLIDLIVDTTSPNISVRAAGHFISYALQMRASIGTVGTPQWNAITLFYEEGGPL